MLLVPRPSLQQLHRVRVRIHTPNSTRPPSACLSPNNISDSRNTISTSSKSDYPQPQQHPQPWPASRKREPHESECGSVLICIWNIPSKVKRSDFNFLMARVPGVERWDFVSRGPSQESAGYAYCECPTMEDAEETMWLIRSFRVANTKLRANLFDPSRVDWSFSPGKIRASREKREEAERKLETYRELDDEKPKMVLPLAEKKKTRPAPRRKKKQAPERTESIRERPPSRRLLLGYANSCRVPRTIVEDGDEKVCQ